MPQPVKVLSISLALLLLASLMASAAGGEEASYQIKTSLISSLVASAILEGEGWQLSGIAGQPVLGETGAEGVFVLEAGYSPLTTADEPADEKRLYLPVVLRH